MWLVELHPQILSSLCMCGLVVSMLYFQNFEWFVVRISVRAETWLEISAPPVPPSQHSYDEYTDRTLTVGRCINI